MIKLKRYTQVEPTISVEQSIAQLESVVIALEAAQENPEVAALLFGPSIGLESDFGTKVKDTVKKLWEALVAFIKKLFGLGVRTEEEVEEILAKADDVMDENIVIPDPIEEAQNGLSELLKRVTTYDEVKIKLSEGVEKFPELPAQKLTAMVKAWYEYHGNPAILNGGVGYHYFNSRVLGRMLEDKAYLGIHSSTIWSHLGSYLGGLTDKSSHDMFGVKLPVGWARVKESLREVRVEKLKINITHIATRDFIRGTRDAVLREDLEFIKESNRILNECEDLLENLITSKVDEFYKPDFSKVRLVLDVGRTLLAIVDKKCRLLSTVIDYVKHFEE